MWERALAGEEFTVAEPLGDPALERRYYEMKFNVLRDANGQRIGAYMFAHDISDRLRDEQRLAETEEHLRQAQKIEAIGQLTGGVAHDFNNLLMVISGGLNLFERADLEKRERLMEGMRNAVERGAALRRQLLAFSRRKPLTPETVELPRQIDGMSELLDRTLRGDVHVETRFEDGLWPVRIDPAELELVLLNLRVNARDAMPDGGTITVTAANTNVVGSELTGDYVCLPVADTGVGMPPEVQAKVFEPFFTTKDVGKGSGLGMAQVYGFAKQSEGGVRVCSTVGK
ncbi:signal transduction histidine kinase [Sphingomonas sp. UYEF23]